MLQEVHVWLALRIKVSRQQTTCPHCGHSLCLAAGFCRFFSCLVTHGEIGTTLIHTSKLRTEKTNIRGKQLLFENILLESLKPLSWCKLFQVWLCPGPDQVNSRTDIFCSCRPLWVPSKDEEMKRKMVFTRMILLCYLLYTLLLMPIAQFHLWLQRKKNLERSPLCSAIRDWSARGDSSSWAVSCVQLPNAGACTYDTVSWSHVLVRNDNTKGFRKGACLITQPDPNCLKGHSTVNGCIPF